MNLAGLSVMVTRPLPNGMEFCAVLQQHGARTVYFPTIEIIEPQHAALLTEQIKQLDQFDWVIFVSPQAVYRTATLIQHSWPIFPRHVKIAAVGAATAELLKKMHLPPSVYPATQWSTEGLLELPEFQSLQKKKIALIRGEGGRELLAKECEWRGAKVSHFIAYQRRLPAYDAIRDYVMILKERRVDIIICSSADSLHNLFLLCGTLNSAMLTHIPLLVVSERLLVLAEEYGFKHVFLAKNAGQNAIIDTLKTVKRMSAI